MKNAFWKLVLCVLVFLTPAFSQQTGIRFDVPFQFQVGQYQLPPGNYRVSAVNDKALLISRIDGSEAVVAMTQGPIEALFASGSVRLVFTKYGNKHFLSETWLMGSSGRKLPKSADEAGYARGVRPNTITVYTATKMN